MKSLISISLLMILLTASASAAPFAPTPLKLSAPNMLMGDFKTGGVKFSFTVTGTPATVIFAVYSAHPEEMATGCRNGWLGWHYMQLVDTCVYVAPPSFYEKGSQTIIWDGKNMDGNPAGMRGYTYYLWGYDAASPGVKATGSILAGRFDRAYIRIHDSGGYPMINPIIYDALPWPGTSGDTVSIIRNKWWIGSDPEDYTLLETTTYRSMGELPRLVPDHGNYTWFFTQELRPDGTLVLRKREWVPNGDSPLETGWGHNGESAFPTIFSPGQSLLPTGPTGEDALLYFANAWRGDDGTRAGVVTVDPVSGTAERVIDLTRWWRDDSGVVCCPSDLAFQQTRGGAFLFCSSTVSCLAMMISPEAEEGTDPVRWVNGYGDSFADRTFAPDSRNPWACVDPDHPLPTRMLSPESDLFSIFPAGDAAASSFGLFGPDGRGIGYLPLPVPGGSALRAIRTMDYDSPFDGLYFGGDPAGGDSAGIRYIAFDSVQGRITLSEWWGGPYVHVLGPYERETLRAGAVRPILWDSQSNTVYASLSIDFSADGGITWSAVADSLDATLKKFSWTVPTVNSPNCRIRITNREYPSIRGLSGTFAISGPTGVTENNRPLTLTLSNSPNPFNPSTAITFTLPAPGRANLIIYDITGRRVRELLSGPLTAGTHSVVWDGKDEHGSAVASGVYISRLTVGKFAATGKMLLVR